MLRFSAENDRIRGWRGLACVALIVAVILLDSQLASLIIRLTGSDLIGTILFWVIGGAVALWTLRYFIMGYSYTLTDSVLRINHLYSRYERELEAIYANSIVAAGAPDAVLARYSGARVVRALLSRCPVAPFAIAIRREGAHIVYLIQVDEPMRERLKEIAKRNAK